MGFFFLLWDILSRYQIYELMRTWQNFSCKMIENGSCILKLCKTLAYKLHHGTAFHISATSQLFWIWSLQINTGNKKLKGAFKHSCSHSMEQQKLCRSHELVIFALCKVGELCFICIR